MLHLGRILEIPHLTSICINVSVCLICFLIWSTVEKSVYLQKLFIIEWANKNNLVVLGMHFK